MIVSPLNELILVGVYDRGVPNMERLVFKCNQYGLNIGRYGVMLGMRAPTPGFAIPLRDNLFWFGDFFLNAGDWIFLFTGPGNARDELVPGTQERMYSIYWGRTSTILNHHDVIPVLFRTDAAQVLNDTPPALPNLSRG